MQVVIGADGCKGGWVFVRLENGAFAAATLYRRFAAGVAASGAATVIGVDIPIGYPAPPALERAADGLARVMLHPRGNTVFPALPPDVLAALDKQIANDIWFERTGQRVNPLSLALRNKILEVVPVATGDPRVYEVHPEVSFRKLAGRPLAPKKQWNGLAQRRACLEAAGIVIPDVLAEAGTTAADNILDAAGAPGCDGRISGNVAASLPEPPERDGNGRQVAIWY